MEERCFSEDPLIRGEQIIWNSLLAKKYKPAKWNVLRNRIKNKLILFDYNKKDYNVIINRIKAKLASLEMMEEAITHSDYKKVA